MSRSVEFWFDYTCPFAYLASTRVRLLAERSGSTLTYAPCLLGGIFKAVNTPQNLFATRSAARSAHEGADMQRWARRFGVELRMPAEHPLRSVEALRATLATGIDPRVVDGFYRAYWVDNRAISSSEVISEVVAAAGHDPAVVLRLIEEAAIKDDLRARTDRAIALGLFGVPTFIVDGSELIWGQDRLDFAFPAKRRVEVYWDFSSPFAYLGCSQIEAIAARRGAEVVWKPILLGGLFRAIGTPDVPLAAFSEAKQRHSFADLERWASHWKVPFRFPSRFPTNSVKALRIYLALLESHRPRYREAVFRAMWAEDRDINDEAVLAECVGDPKIASEAFARAQTDDVKAKLRTETELAAARGVFGVPTFIVDGELYWGQDRLVLVEDALT